MKLKQWNYKIFTSLVFVYFVVLSLLLGYNADDYWWGGNKSLYSYLTSPRFFNYDGRYVGDGLAIIGMHYPVLAALIYGVTLAVIIYSVYSLTHRFDLMLATFVAILIMPKGIFAQTLGWKAGFFNYALSIVPILILLLVTKYILLDSKTNNLSFLSLIGVCVILFFGSFMSEPITLTLLIDTVVLIFVSKFLNSKRVKEFVCFFAFSLLETICMFANRGYWKDTGVHKYGLGASIPQILLQLRLEYILIFILGLCVAAFILKRSKKQRLAYTLIVLNAITFVLAIVSEKIVLFNKISSLSSYLVLLCLGISILVFFCNYRLLNKKEFWISLFLVLNACASIIPYIVVSPFGPRCMLCFYILMVIFSFYLLAISNLLVEKWFTILIASLAVLYSSFLLFKANQINIAKTRNSALIEYQVKNKTYAVNNNKFYYVQIPNTDMWWNPRLQTHDDPIMSYYKIPTTTVGKLVPWYEVKDIPSNQGEKLYKKAKEIVK